MESAVLHSFGFMFGSCGCFTRARAVSKISQLHVRLKFTGKFRRRLTKAALLFPLKPEVKRRNDLVATIVDELSFRRETKSRCNPFFESFSTTVVLFAFTYDKSIGSI